MIHQQELYNKNDCVPSLQYNGMHKYVTYGITIWLGDLFQGTAHDFIFYGKLLIILCVLTEFINLVIRQTNHQF